MGGSQAEPEQRVTPLERFFDLVVVSAFAQVMTLTGPQLLVHSL
jgi:low temperature requirement protein LtrA